MKLSADEFVRILDGWDEVSLAIDRMLTALPQQMTGAAANLEDQRRVMRQLLSEISRAPQSDWDIGIEFNNRDGYTGIRRWTRLPADVERWTAEPDAGRFEFFISLSRPTTQEAPDAHR